MTTAVKTPTSITQFPAAEVYDGELNTDVHGVPRIFNAGLSANPEDSTPYTFSNGVVARTNRLYCTVQNDLSCFFQTFEANPTHPLCCAPTDADQSIKSKSMVRYTAITLECAINYGSELAQKIALARAPGLLMGRRTALIQGATSIATVCCQLISAYAHESPAVIAHDCMLDILMRAELASARANSLLKANTSGTIIHLLDDNNSLLTDRLIRWPLPQNACAFSSRFADDHNSSFLADRLIRWPLPQDACASSSGFADSGAAAAATSTSIRPFHSFRRGCCVFNEDLTVILRTRPVDFYHESLSNPPPGARALAAAAAAAAGGVVVRANRLYCTVQNSTCSFRTFWTKPARFLRLRRYYDATRRVAVTVNCEVNPQSEFAQKIALAQAPDLMGRRTTLIQAETRITSASCQLISSYAHESSATIAHTCMLDILMKAQLTRIQPDSGLKAALSNHIDILDEKNRNPLTLTDRLIRWPLLIDRLSLSRRSPSQQAQASSSGSAGSGAAAAAATSTNNMPFHNITLVLKALTKDPDVYSFIEPFGPEM